MIVAPPDKCAVTVPPRLPFAAALAMSGADELQVRVGKVDRVMPAESVTVAVTP